MRKMSIKVTMNGENANGNRISGEIEYCANYGESPYFCLYLGKSWIVIDTKDFVVFYKELKEVMEEVIDGIEKTQSLKARGGK